MTEIGARHVMLAVMLVSCLAASYNAATYDDITEDVTLQQLLASSGVKLQKPDVGVFPKRPENFRNVEELNSYLAEMRQFYALLGRPRLV